MDDFLSFNKEYYSRLLEIVPKKIFLGIDPFPKLCTANGIAFCKKDITDLFNSKYSSFNILKGIGYKRDDKLFPQSQDYFYSILTNEKLGFLNASHYLLRELKKKGFDEKLAISKSFEKNKVVLNNCETIFISKSALNIISGFKEFKTLNLKNKMEIVIHPSNLNRKNKLHKKYWQTEGGFRDQFLT